MTLSYYSEKDSLEKLIKRKAPTNVRAFLLREPVYQDFI